MTNARNAFPVAIAAQMCFACLSRQQLPSSLACLAVATFADAPKTALLAMDPDRKLFHGPEARPLPPTNGVSWHGQLEFRPALEQSLQRALSLNPCQLVA